jgi:ferredoxin/flavodoxin
MILVKNIIFYFTGTGNSLVVARDIANKIGDTKLVSISHAISEDFIDLSYERIGFVFPVYFSSVPVIVKRFLEELNFNKSQYVFCILTYGGTYVSTFSIFNNYITKRGGILSSGFPVRMPGNYIVKYGAYPKLLQRMLLKGEKKKVDHISYALKEKKILFKAKESFITSYFTAYGEKRFVNFGKGAQNFYINDKCNGCASCERICPVNNIKIKSEQPNWGNECEQCMACIQWCPMKAIEYTNKTVKRKRYQHPEIKMSDLL